MAAQLSALAELDELFATHDLSYWLFGGWAVDFHAGHVTREHADMDIAVWSVDRTRVTTLLRESEWMHCPEEGEDGYTCFERDGVRLELAFLARDDHGQIHTPLRDGRGEWPAGSFGDDIAELRGVRIHVVSRESLIVDKSTVRSDDATASKDRADIASLVRTNVAQ
ncbi:MAG: nucleotidyltransferase domain-containing protein [Gemmatimonadaceae bacterium]